MTRRRRSKRSVLAVLITMTAISGGLVAAGKPVVPSGTKPTGVSAATLARQHALDELAYKLTDNLPEGQRHRIPGYAGLVVDPEKGRLNLYWKGELPVKVRTLTKRTGKGLSVVTEQAAYSAAEVTEAREKLAAATDAGRLTLDGTHRWHTLSVAPDGSGLQLEFAPEPGLAPAQTTAAVATVAAEATKITGGVRVVAASAPAPETTARQDDWAPWWGGAAVLTPRGSRCSTGFGVWRDGVPHMLTAAHCGMDGVYTDPTGEWIGDVAMAHPERDVTLVHAFNGGISPHYYDGDWATNSGKHIARANINNNGDYVCSSGARSGIHCNVQVYNDNTWYKPEEIDYVIKPVIRARRTNLNEPASVSGDSGGPVVTTADGTWGYHMEARGIISGGGGDRVVCDPNGMADPDKPNIKCYADVIYAPIMPALTLFGLAIAI